MFALGLGQVNVHTCINLLGMLCDCLDHLGRGRVLTVNAQVNLQSAITCVLITRKQVAIVLVGGSLLVIAVIKDGQSTAQVALDARFQNGIRHGLAEKVHVGERYRTKTQHFGNGQTGCRCDGCVAELVLKRENTLVQPALQRQVLTVTAQQSHGCMRVRVDHTGHEQLALSIISLTKILGRTLGTDIRDLVRLDAYILAVLDGKIIG